MCFSFSLGVASPLAVRERRREGQGTVAYNGVLRKFSTTDEAISHLFVNEMRARRSHLPSCLPSSARGAFDLSRAALK